ncbi:MAG: flagellar hook-associated protein FlgL [Planctomycetes bacterium]|nr:flagellar hook-associated protein FlgL [Planctomycetota bacterium]
MSLRITQSMLYSRSLDDLRRSLAGSTRLQEMVATGRRINRPSDDPAAALRILPLNAEIRDLERMADNVALARESLDLAAANLQDTSSLMLRARELTVQAANGTMSERDRQGLAAEFDQLLDQLVSLGNSRRGDRYLFAGTRSDRAPFALVTDAAGTRVVYSGDGNPVSLELAPGLDSDVLVPGDRLFLRRERGATTFEGDTGAAPSGASDSGVGFDLLRVTFAGLAGAPPGMSAGSGPTTALGALTWSFAGGALSIGGGPAVPVTFPVTNQTFTTADGRTVSLSLSAAPVPATGTLTAEAELSIDGGTSTARVDFAASEVQVRNSLEGTVLNVNVAALQRTGTELVKYEGTFDAFTSLIAVRDTLRNTRGESQQTVSARLTSLLGELDAAHEGVLGGLREFGSRSENTILIGSRVQAMRDSAREALSLTQDADLAESIVAFNQQQMVYQAALGVSSRVIQTSLLDFLR